MKYSVGNEPIAPDILIVLDRSLSMNDGTPTSRWSAATKALRVVTAQLDTAVRFGLVAFPGAAKPAGSPMPMLADCSALRGQAKDDCDVENAVNSGVLSGCEAGTLAVPVDFGNAGKIGSALDELVPRGSTPTAASLDAAHALLGSLPVGPVRVQGSKLVLLVTDGEPNCAGTEERSIAKSLAAIESLAKDRIKTYVLGYDTRTGTAKDVMDRMAVAGATGDTQHRPVEDEASLVRTFRAIATDAISCEFALEESPPDSSYVQVGVDGRHIYLDQPDGWSLSPDGKTLTVLGASCDALRSAGEHNLSVDVLCEHVMVQ